MEGEEIAQLISTFGVLLFPSNGAHAGISEQKGEPLLLYPGN
jgi:hypothetical protein